MRAIEVARFGGPEVLQARELPDPVPGAGQALVLAQVCDVLFLDTMIRSGQAANYFPVRPPYVPGNGVGGTVAAVGQGVDSTWLGRSVVASTGTTGPSGGYAELAAVDLQACIAVPEGVGLLDAAAVLHDGTTAQGILETTGITPGEWVLVLGAAGGMGLLLVQLLCARGARVVGAARGRRKRDAVTRAGAQAVVDYAQEGWADAVLDATGGTGPAVILDGVGGAVGSAAFGLIAEGGRFSAHGAPSGSFASIDPEEARRQGIAVTTIADVQYVRAERPRLLAATLGEIRAGRVKPLVGQTFSLADASKAHSVIEDREALGKTLLLTELR